MLSVNAAQAFFTASGFSTTSDCANRARDMPSERNRCVPVWPLPSPACLSLTPKRTIGFPEAKCSLTISAVMPRMALFVSPVGPT